MLTPKPTTYEIVSITVVVAGCPWCDSKDEIIIDSDAPDNEKVYDCNQCHRPFTLIMGE